MIEKKRKEAKKLKDRTMAMQNYLDIKLEEMKRA